MTIPAEVHTDDWVAQAEFDAEIWMIQASDEKIEALAKCEWGGDYPADEVAEFMESRDPQVKAVFEYKHAVNLHKTMGFECHVNEEAAWAWLESRRPFLFDKLTQPKT